MPILINANLQMNTFTLPILSQVLDGDLSCIPESIRFEAYLVEDVLRSLVIASPKLLKNKSRIQFESDSNGIIIDFSIVPSFAESSISTYVSNLKVLAKLENGTFIFGKVLSFDIIEDVDVNVLKESDMHANTAINVSDFFSPFKNDMLNNDFMLTVFNNNQADISSAYETAKMFNRI